MPNYAKSTGLFIYEAMHVHGDRYDYSEVEYVGTHVPVRIKCTQCGIVFLQEPSSHLAGHGCPKCNKKQTHRKIKQDDYIARAKKVHGDKYDYSRVVYTIFNESLFLRNNAQSPDATTGIVRAIPASCA